MTSLEQHEEFLSVYLNRSELHSESEVKIFREGRQGKEAQQRYNKIATELDNGFLEKRFERTNDSEADTSHLLSDENKKLLRHLISGITSEVGRALIEVAFLQITIKCIAPEQSIRLHKSAKSGKSFSWVDGVSMRTLDSTYIQRFLHEYHLLDMNKYGAFMTRSLAENYPYTRLYKARLRGPFAEWIDIVDALENGTLPPDPALGFLMILLKNRSDTFNASVRDALNLCKRHDHDSFDEVKCLLEEFFNKTKYSARAFEVVMHCFMQAMQENRLLGDYELVPLSQMRSANKKHGNVGDIELKDGGIIVESWDAKYGKPYLRDELEELYDKIELHPGVVTAGFVVNSQPDLRDDIKKRIDEIQDSAGVNIYILSFEEWIEFILRSNCVTSDQREELASHWLNAVVSSFGQLRPELATIDEPCDEWITDLIRILK